MKLIHKLVKSYSILKISLLNTGYGPLTGIKRITDLRLREEICPWDLKFVFRICGEEQKKEDLDLEHTVLF